MKSFRRLLVVDCPWHWVEFGLLLPSMRGEVLQALIGTTPARRAR